MSTIFESQRLEATKHFLSLCNEYIHDDQRPPKWYTNGSQLKNPDISGAVYTLRIQYEYIVCILKLNLKMAQDCQGSLIDSR